jgi:ankyrin repeat protein
MAASGGGLTELVKLLLDKGANINAKSDDGTTALILAVRNGKPEVEKLLREKGAT